MDQRGYRGMTRGRVLDEARETGSATQGLEGPDRVPTLHLQTHQNRMSQKFWNSLCSQDLPSHISMRNSLQEMNPV